MNYTDSAAWSVDKKSYQVLNSFLTTIWIGLNKIRLRQNNKRNEHCLYVLRKKSAEEKIGSDLIITHVELSWLHAILGKSSVWAWFHNLGNVLSSIILGSWSCELCACLYTNTMLGHEKYFIIPLLFSNSTLEIHSYKIYININS